MNWIGLNLTLVAPGCLFITLFQPYISKVLPIWLYKTQLLTHVSFKSAVKFDAGNIFAHLSHAKCFQSDSTPQDPARCDIVFNHAIIPCKNNLCFNNLGWNEKSSASWSYESTRKRSRTRDVWERLWMYVDILFVFLLDLKNSSPAKYFYILFWILTAFKLPTHTVWKYLARELPILKWKLSAWYVLNVPCRSFFRLSTVHPVWFVPSCTRLSSAWLPGCSCGGQRCLHDPGPSTTR